MFRNVYLAVYFCSSIAEIEQVACDIFHRRLLFHGFKCLIFATAYRMYCARVLTVPSPCKNVTIYRMAGLVLVAIDVGLTDLALCPVSIIRVLY